MKLRQCSTGNTERPAACRISRYPDRRRNCTNGTSDGVAIMSAITTPAITRSAGLRPADLAASRAAAHTKYVTHTHAPYAIAAGNPASAYASAINVTTAIDVRLPF